jgi:hypothetical protein
MKVAPSSCIIAVLLIFTTAVLTLNAQVIGLPVNPSSIKSGIVSGSVYDVTLKDGTRQTGNYHSLLDEKGNGTIVSWPDGGEATITRVRNGNAVIFGPSGN